MIVVFEKMLISNPNWNDNVKEAFQTQPMKPDLSTGLF